MFDIKKTLLILAVLHCTAGFSQLHNALEIAGKMYPGWNLGNTLEGGGNDNNYTNKGGLGAEKAWQGTTTTQQIIDFVDHFTMKPEEIRKTVEHLSWKFQMEEVIRQVMF